MTNAYDAILVVGFGGPEKREDVLPFLENVLRGRNVPRERMLEVAEHYHRFDGVSPINAQVRKLLAALEPELKRQGVSLPVYWGNRNWHPMLADALREMAQAGVKRAIALVLVAYSSYSSCRQYREDIERARATVGDAAPVVDKVRVFYNHPEFIAATAERLQDAVATLPETHRSDFRIAFTAHSIPTSMASKCDYERQLTETCRLTAETLGIPSDRWKLVFQSRSGRPEDPWLEPDICDHLRSLGASGAKAVVVMPVGFLSDHIEVLFDLDEQAKAAAEASGLVMARSKTVGTHPRFVTALASLIRERTQGETHRAAIGQYPANHDVCPIDCCPAPMRPGRPT